MLGGPEGLAIADCDVTELVFVFVDAGFPPRLLPCFAPALISQEENPSVPRTSTKSSWGHVRSYRNRTGMLSQPNRYVGQDLLHECLISKNPT